MTISFHKSRRGTRIKATGPDAQRLLDALVAPDREKQLQALAGQPVSVTVGDGGAKPSTEAPKPVPNRSNSVLGISGAAGLSNGSVA